MVLFLFALLALLLLTLVSGGYTFFVACLRRKEPDWLKEEELAKTPYGKYFESIVAANNWLTEHSAQDVYITSDDGLRLHGLWVPAANPKGTILFAHGYRSSMLVDIGMAMDFYYQKGMNLLIPEQRCHGKSQGRYITFGIKESNDMFKWLTYHNCILGDFPVVLSGLSMGASTMLYLADRDLPENVKGIIADCGFTSPKEIISYIFKRVTKLPAIPSIWVTDMFAHVFAGIGLNDKDSRKTLAKNKLPIRMIHGTADDFVPCEMTKEGFGVCTGSKKLLLSEGAGHGVSFLKDREKYEEMISNFLEEILN